MVQNYKLITNIIFNAVSINIKFKRLPLLKTKYLKTGNMNAYGKQCERA